MVTPLTVTPGWLRDYLQYLSVEGFLDFEARQAASRQAGIEGKTFGRCHIRDGVLTVPVAGGGSVLKKRTANPILSEHGKWRREHLGAWNAAYGRTPYYPHLIPEIERVYSSSEGMTLEEFNSGLLSVALDWLDFASVTSETVNKAPKRDRLHALGQELLVQINPELSIFDALFRLGPDAVFALYPW